MLVAVAVFLLRSCATDPRAPIILLLVAAGIKGWARVSLVP